MDTQIRVLIVEDSADDALLVVRELEKGGYAVKSQRVDTPKEMSAALKKQTWDIVLADFRMPRFNGLDALNLLKESKRDIPFIIVSGKIGEETAVELMLAGADDYIMKTNLKRLAPAVKRELREAEVHRERQQAEAIALKSTADLMCSEEKYRLLVETASEGIVVLQGGIVRFANASFYNIVGFPDLIANKFIDIIHPDEQKTIRNYLEKSAVEFSTERFVTRIVDKKGDTRWIEVGMTPVAWESSPAEILFVTDITERREAVDNLQRLNQMLLTVRKVNQLIVEIDDESTLLPKICSTLADGRSYKLARIGFIQEGNYDIQPVAQAGFPLEPPMSLKVTWDDSEYGSNPSGMAIKTGKPVVIQDVGAGENYRFWRHIASKDGFTSVAALPLTFQDKVIGMLAVYSEKKDVFNEEEIELLKELAGDISLGITKIRQRIESARTEAKYAALIDNSNDGIIILQDAKVKFSSKYMDRMTGFSAIDYLNKSFLDFITPGYRELVTERYKKRTTGQEIPNRYEIEILTKDGKPIPVELNVSLIEYENRPAEMAIVRDIRERKQAEEALRRSEENYRHSLDNSPVGILIGTIEGEELYCNRALLDLYGYSSLDELKSVPKEKVFTSESLESYQEYIEKVKQVGFIPYQRETGIRLKNGEIRYILTTAAEVFWNGSREIQMVNQDITGNKRAQEALKESEERYRTLADSSPIGIYIVQDGRFKFVNPKFQQSTGYTSKELLEMESLTLVHSEDRELVRNSAVSMLKGQSSLPYEFRVITKDGKIIWAMETVASIVYNGRPAVLSNFMDVTDRKKAEDKIRIFSDAMAGSTDGIGIADLEGRIMYINRAFETMYGYKTSEIVGQLFSVINDNPELGEDMRRAFLEKRSWNGEVESSKKNGDRFPVLLSLSFVKDDKNKPIAVMGSARDISDRKESERQLREGYEKLRKMFSGVTKVISAMVEMRDPYTAGHETRVASLARAIAREMNFTEERAEQMYTAGIVHDIGKISIPTEILTKPGKINEIEFSLIKLHAKAGHDILANVEFNYPVANWVLEHHERVNGSGYPNCLKDNQISAEAKILAVADVVEAMSSHRPYRPSLGIESALLEIIKGKSILYDANVVDACLRVFKEKGFKF